MNKPITIMLDASACKGASCDFRLHLNVVEGWKTPINSNDIEFGSAFHKFRAHWREHGDAGFGEALVLAKNHLNNAKCTVKSNKTYLTEEFLWMACIGYKNRYSNDNFQPIIVPASRNETGKDVNMIEPSTRFSFPIYVDAEVEVIIAGTIDELGKFDNNLNAICDCKTSGVWNVKEYLEQYELDSQLKFYRWALGRYALMFPDSYIAELVNQGIACFIDGVFYAGKDKPIQFERSKVFLYKDYELEELDRLIEAQVERLVTKTKAWIKSDKRPDRNGLLNASCKTVYGECDYAKVCRGQDLETQQILLERFYKKEFYNPLNHGK